MTDDVTCEALYHLLGGKTNVNRGKMTIRPCVVIKLMVPADSALGVQIIASRKERDPRESKAAKARASRAMPTDSMIDTLARVAREDLIP